MLRLSDVRGRAWRAYADARRGLARSGDRRGVIARLDLPPRRHLHEWLAATDAAHQTYRSSTEVPSGGVAVVCVTRRPQLLERLIANIDRQQLPERAAVVIVANSDRFGVAEIETAMSTLDARRWEATALRQPSSVSLGACLNIAMAASEARFVAKFDDDDWYGAYYLADGLRAHGYAAVAVVGKHSYYAHIEEFDETVLRFPGNDLRYSGTLAGGTLIIDRERSGDLEFADLSLGEDRAFLGVCHRRGLSTFSADRFNFVQFRGTDNTWTAPAEAFVRGALAIGPGVAYEQVER